MDKHTISPTKQTDTRLSVFDLHCDTLTSLLADAGTVDFASPSLSPEALRKPSQALSLLDNRRDVSLQLMRAANWCQCFAVFVPDNLSGEAAWQFYQQVKRSFQLHMRQNAADAAQVCGGNGIAEAFASGRTAAMLTVEGASFLSDSLVPLDEIASDGVKMVALTWNSQNAIASGTMASGGFSRFGLAVVKALEDKLITIDASHLNDQSFSDLLAAASRPFIASHSNSRAVTGHPRNLTDSQFQAIQERGGVVGMNFHNGFLTDQKRAATLDDLLAHLDHWLLLGGIDTIALGSDYDGADIAGWLKPCDKLPVLYQNIRQAFDEEVADRLFFSNAHRFFGERG